MPFALPETALTDTVAAQRGTRAVAQAAYVFDLSLPDDLPDRVPRLPLLLSQARNDLNNAYAFHAMVEGICGGVDDDSADTMAACAGDLQAYGLPVLAQILTDYVTLAHQTPLWQAKPAPYDSACAKDAALQQQLQALQARWAAATRDAPDTIIQSAAERVLNVCFLPWAQYDAFWVQQITTASGFAKPSRVRRRLGAQAFAPLGSEVITTLKARGYDPLFTFWHRPLAEARGIIYLQTRAGPVRLLDASPSMRKATQFPVHVQTLDGAALLTLSTADSVPKRRFVLRTFGRT